MKRVIILGIILTLAFSLSVCAAPDADQIIELKTVNDELAFVATEPTTFWEIPTLRAGESFVTSGTLSIVNKTDLTRNITFDQVIFPFEDEQALEYLNHLTLIIKNEDMVLYNGPYSRINDADNKPSLKAMLPPGESCVYTIQLKCDYTYTGSDFTNETVLEWRFRAPVDSDTQSEDETENEPIRDPLVTQWGLAVAVTILIFVFLARSSKRA